MVFSAFPAGEYVTTGLWFVAAVAAALLLPRGRAVRLSIATVGIVVFACVLGAAASAAGGPLAVVLAQPARLSALVVLFGVLLAAAYLVKRWSAGAAIALVSIFVVGVGVGEVFKHVDVAPPIPINAGT